MRSIAIAAIGAAFFATAANAAEVAPDSVAFGTDGIVAASLTGAAGDPANGKSVFVNRKLGNCLACHVNSDANEHSFHGEIGPSLDGAASRWNEAQLRGILVNSKMTFEDTMMPSFYRLVNGERTMDKFAGKTILTAAQLEDVLAYLQTLK
ncbi:MAG: sulfur oxidation c-type cytochrome SoxX [Rhodobacteraceae bacterium]|nr:sulfur oxidation c-type cytochrome SoxX [Paracoccaceae bacterium]